MNSKAVFVVLTLIFERISSTQQVAEENYRTMNVLRRNGSPIVVPALGLLKTKNPVNKTGVHITYYL
jgi:hypothetical protein